MVKMVSMKKSAADRAVEKKALGEARTGVPQIAGDLEGPTVHLEHHHLKNMGVEGGFKSGDKFSMEATGSVESSESRMENGEPRHGARLRIHRMGVERDAPKGDEAERGALRNDIEKSHAQSEKGRGEAMERRGLKAAESGKEIVEKK